MFFIDIPVISRPPALTPVGRGGFRWDRGRSRASGGGDVAGHFRWRLGRNRGWSVMVAAWAPGLPRVLMVPLSSIVSLSTRLPDTSQQSKQATKRTKILVLFEFFIFAELINIFELLYRFFLGPTLYAMFLSLFIPRLSQSQTRLTDIGPQSI